MLKILTIVGARPQFVKAATLSRIIRENADVREVIVHTGQHYDKNMSDIFFKELDIPLPDYNLEVGSGNHGKQTGLMIQKIEEVVVKENPDWVLVYGDTNSTIAGALAATKLHVKVAHVEAGLRSFNRKMPEEINRIATDSISDILFAPTKNALKQLTREGQEQRAVFSGDVMYDSVLFYHQKIKNNKASIKMPGLPSDFYLATVHRAENTDDHEKLAGIFTAFSLLDKKVIFPAHPRVRKYLKNLIIPENILFIDPVGYLQMLILIDLSSKVFTDSGGLQKECYFLKKQCITLRNETEWIETLHNNWNILAGTNPEKIISASKTKLQSDDQKKSFGEGDAAQTILNHLIKYQNN